MADTDQATDILDLSAPGTVVRAAEYVSEPLANHHEGSAFLRRTGTICYCVVSVVGACLQSSSFRLIPFVGYSFNTLH